MGSRGNALARVQWAEPPWKLMGFSTLKVQEKPVSEDKIHTFTPSLSGFSFDYVLTFLFHAFLICLNMFVMMLN